jgi:hypothetical protein
VPRYKRRAVDRIAKNFGRGGGGGKGRTWGRRLRSLPFVFIPGLRWLAMYNVRKYLRDDIIAGVTVGIMLIPQVRTSI